VSTHLEIEVGPGYTAWVRGPGIVRVTDRLDIKRMWDGDAHTWRSRPGASRTSSLTPSCAAGRSASAPPTSQNQAVTDTRLAESFLMSAKIDHLSDASFRIYVNSLVWSTAQGTDGALTDRALRLLHPDGVKREVIQELIDAHLWEITGPGNSLRIHDYLDYQTPREQVERSRQLTRHRKAKQRAQAQDKELAKATEGDTSRVTGRVTDAVPPKDRTVDRTGQERTGSENGTNNGTGSDTYNGGSLTDWGAKIV